MNAHQLMTRDPATCRPDDALDLAARLMWECDSGVVPVVDEQHRVVGMLTDRDALMAAFTQGRALHELPVALAMSASVVTCRPDDDISRVEGLMRQHQLRRLAVVDEERRLIGIVSLNDLAVKGAPRIGLAETLAEICAPHPRAQAA
jgi:CBS domain-containing protein